MSSIGQSILMALTVTVNKYASLNVQAIPSRRESTSPATSSRRTNPKAKTPVSDIDIGRRGILVSTVAATPQVKDSTTEFLKKYLKKSEENKAKNDKERLDSYYKRNYKDYFEFIEGSLKAKEDRQLSESEKGILDWLKTNK
ncbi:uncharacterized protein LOC123213735 [Mangifera indica]|uniref:uncharacterized protein LOC123213735 n=1 Tax=Mangifera indica TaxID=29780 RepID=UPI001CF9C427|nr:uncharacterized protein LOC123213735 [Mangifera indica]